MSDFAGIVQDDLHDRRGNALTGAVLRVYDATTTTPATIYDNAVEIAVATPGDLLVNHAVTGLPAASGLNEPGLDAEGNFTFYADADLTFDIHVTWQGQTFDFTAQPVLVRVA